MSIVEDTRIAISNIENPLATRDEVLTALNIVARLKELAKELGEQAERAAIEWINVNGEIVDGDMRFYVAPNKTHKCKDTKGVLAALLEESGGDLDAVAECFASGAWKPGETKKRLGDRANQFFETVETPDLKTGVAKPRVQKVNTAFQR